ncbi:hypothetical protein SKAU_G00148440 [Synaphobranchus kaupii]|uniref:Uncharacterized protein n=1 Tax=Synaphobranchus kaupii TaxID=118154 RepID=A0A9Q1FTX6_SYNKA|nr:hypothetical protein SKAU_G00148440 [Synaphobranchus kaupii]
MRLSSTETRRELDGVAADGAEGGVGTTYAEGGGGAAYKERDGRPPPLRRRATHRPFPRPVAPASWRSPRATTARTSAKPLTNAKRRLLVAPPLKR